LINLLFEEQEHLRVWVNTAGVGFMALDEKAKKRVKKIDKLLKEICE